MLAEFGPESCEPAVRQLDLDEGVEEESGVGVKIVAFDSHHTSSWTYLWVFFQMEYSTTSRRGTQLQQSWPTFLRMSRLRTRSW